MNIRSALIAGLAGTAAMTLLMLTGPIMGMPEMRIGRMLGSFLGIGTALGWAIHVMIGVTLAGGYAAFFAGRLPGPAGLRGALFGFLVFLLAQLVVMPVMGAGVFSGGNAPMIMGSLLGHLVFGGILGALYTPTPRSVASPTVAA